MPQYRGNIGNLLQHWVLCDLVKQSNAHWAEIRFVDAYSMAPFATERFKPGLSGYIFDHARDRAVFDSDYEDTWRRIGALKPGYPNSAAFLTALWRGKYSLLLCEWDGATVDELQLWKPELESRPDCIEMDIAPGDWRNRFQQGVSQSDQLTLMSFDPDMFNRKGSKSGRNMTPADLEVIARAVMQIPGPVVIQLSTYDVNDDNSQRDVEPAIVAGLHAAGLTLNAVVKADGKMMSLVLGRFSNTTFGEGLSTMPVRFESWLQRLKMSASREAQPNQRLHPSAALGRLPPLPRLPRSRRG
jgi:hypothetical protein